jgi:DNA topoisomerase I
VYQDEHGRRIRDRITLDRIRSLGIPPAYTRVWICPVPNGHIQATAVDARGRTQYIYHPDWVANHRDGKFHRMLTFVRALPKIRRRIAHDLALRGMPKRKVLAAIVRLLDTTFIRIGNEEYAKENHSFGLTTLRNRHIHGVGEGMRLMFQGKDGVAHDIPVEDARIRKIIATCHDLPGKKLFEFVDHDGALHGVQSDDVNAYLAEISGEDITAKDFRTWHGTAIAAQYLWSRPPAVMKRDIQHDVTVAVQRAAEALGNTPTVCKKSYIHPQVLAQYRNGSFLWHAPTSAQKSRQPLLHVGEIALMQWLKRTDRG